MRRVHLTSQLPTSSTDITSKAGSAGPGNLPFGQDLFDCSQSRQAWGSESVPVAITVFGGIVDDQVHHAQAKNLPVSMDEIGQGVSLSRAVVYSPQKQVLDHESSVVFCDIRIESGHQLLQRIGLVDRHQPGTQGIVGSVQGNSQIDLPIFDTKTFNTRNNTARRNRDASLSQIKAIFVVQQQNSLLDVVVVEKRLPHAHEHNVGDLFSFGFQLEKKDNTC